MIELPRELEEKILSLTPIKSFTRFRSVCKRWNALFNDKLFVNHHLSLARPQFILFYESKICIVDVNLDGPSIEVHNIPNFVPGYGDTLAMTVECCDGLLMFSTIRGIGICNPWLRQIIWNKSIVHTHSGIGYDNSTPDKEYKIFGSCSYAYNDSTLHANIIKFGSDAKKPKTYKVAIDLCSTSSSVSLNGNLYWIVSSRVCDDEHFIQTFDFSTEMFEFYCTLPTKISSKYNHPRYLDVYRGDRFSYLEQQCDTRNMEIWVTRKKIKNKGGEAVEWMKLMNVSVPECWSFEFSFWYKLSYFIDDKSLSLVLCSCTAGGKTSIYIAKGDKFNEIKLDNLVEDHPLLRLTYFPSLVQVPTFTVSSREPVDSRFALPKGVEVSNGVGEIEWDDGFFDHIWRIYVGESDHGGVFLKCDYIRDNMNFVGAGHWSAKALIPDQPEDSELMIFDDDYIEAIEGTYTESQITSLTFLTKGHWRLSCGHLNGKPFVLRGVKGSKIIGFYGRSSGDHLTALGIHLSAPG
ncbi:unnamed protein product [Eruca vesicaria subsp. sativa]|uniref:F-box domain-containing protein n=1 Tax=Eruca vesicaria subsp. sativa TaxID=29727 RepID=A0ABC8M583_ERUVS|nr:unnamed protein product [Eruca vesicaria subsp. sativa]